jgi:LacI family transcriptional regulator
MISPAKAAQTPTILYLHHAKNPAKNRRVLDGMRRFARTVGWDVVPAGIDGMTKAAVRKLVLAQGATGCVLDAEGNRIDWGERPFGPKVPVVLIDPENANCRNATAALLCDNAAIADAAFRELTAGHPPSFAAITYWNPALRWARERVEAFRAICAESKRDCAIFQARGIEAPEVRMERLAEWAAALPNNVAIFAVNDFTAVETAIALHSRHRHIPKTATLVGVDGFPERHDIPPSPVAITSVDVNFESAGFLAAKMLWDVVATKSTKEHKDFVNSVSFVAKNATFGPLLVVRRASTGGRGRRERFVLEAAEAIRREACDGLTASELAARFPVSRKHFERRFREATGHSVLDEILHVRLEQVQAYLLRRDVAIDAIAGFCGFGSGIELRRLFRRRFGMSMSEWRARNSV